jgi:FAD/FMN-containing dehydrogenase/Fe-S oxidoreductase
VKKRIFSLEGIAKLVRGKQQPGKATGQQSNPSARKTIQSISHTQASDPLAGNGNGSPVTRKDWISESDVLAWVERAKSAGQEYPGASDIATELKKATKGEVRFSDGDRALYATDGSNYRQIPIGITIPKTKEDIIRTVEICKKHQVPILSRGGGTSLAGQCCNVAVIMDMSKYYDRLIELDPQNKFAIVQPGLVLDELRAAAEQHHLTFAPDPSTHNYCTLGGMIGNNSCGTHSVMGGTTADNVLELEILLYDGTRMRVGPTDDQELARILALGGRQAEIYRQLLDFRGKYGDLIRKRFPDIPRRVSGYNLPALLPENGFNVARAVTGSESTLVTVLEAKLRLVDSPPNRTVLVLGYPDIFSAAEHVPEIMQFKPIALEGLDQLLVSFMKEKRLYSQYTHLLPEGDGWLVVEFGGDTKEEAEAHADKLMDALKKVKNPPSMKLYDNKEAELEIWKIRESGLGATARVPGLRDSWEGWEDSAVHPVNLSSYLKGLRELLDKYGYKPVSLYGHFGQGCVHCRIPFDLKTLEGVEHWRRFLDEASDLVLSHNGSVSGEHGDGQSRADLLPKMFGPELIKAFEEFKSIWDPDWKMNPGKVVRPNSITSNLRLGPTYSPATPETHFQYIDDGDSFARATERCVGVGECRRHEGGTMCPSYMATREEMHSTRGRAHLLFEMLQGQVVQDGWRDKHVHDALDLCLSCKGCKSDCPVNVDIATLKAEFLSHYYDKRLRPRNAYAFGLIHLWARAASYVPNIVNFVTQTPGLRELAKWAANVHSNRKIPKFATITFKEWFKKRPRVNVGKTDVLLFPDTFNDHFHPDTAMAAVEVLEDAGFHVLIPQQDLCCGRPLYDYGMLYAAKRWLSNSISVLAPYAEAGLSIVFLEPSCLAVFRDEISMLFPGNEDAARIRNQSFALSEFISTKAPDYLIPELQRKVLLQIHCHHKSVISQDDQKELLKKMKAEIDMPEPGCCGMAGSFGFEAGHYDVSIKIAEQHLVPALSKAPKEQIILADGFSCREQIRQSSDREALHTAQTLKLAKELPQGSEQYPERKILHQLPHRLTRTEMCLAAGAVLTALSWLLSLRKRKQA